MSEQFLNKTGVVISYIASELSKLKKGDRIPSVTEWQEKKGFARGTIQNAVLFLKEENAIRLHARGHLGTFIQAIDYVLLQKYVLTDTFSALMNVPTTRREEGLATGLYTQCLANAKQLNFVFMRGSKERTLAVSSRLYHIAIVSEFAAKQAIEQALPIKIVSQLGAEQGLNGYHLVLATEQQTHITDGMRVAIDSQSFENVALTEQICKGMTVELVDMPSHHMLRAVKEKRVDAAVWYGQMQDDLYMQPLKELDTLADMYQSVVICHEADRSTQDFFMHTIDLETVISEQRQVEAGTMQAYY